MKATRIGALTAIGTLALAAVATPAHAATGGKVTVIHGVPDLVVDVYVNGDLTLDDFEPGTVTDPLDLPAGTYDLAIRAGDAAADADPVLSASATVTDGLNASIIAHLDADGAPKISVFANDTAPIAAGNGRLTVRHTAAAPAVDVRANGTVAFSNLTNPNEAKADLAAGTISADVVLAGTSDVAIGPADVTLTEGTSTIVYAIGSAADGNLELAVQTISGLHSGPTSVDTGTGGLLESGSSTMPVWAAILAGFSVLALGAGGTALVRARNADAGERR